MFDLLSHMYKQTYSILYGEDEEEKGLRKVKVNSIQHLSTKEEDVLNKYLRLI